jgi:uncharacterized UPF0160 family protein
MLSVATRAFCSAARTLTSARSTKMETAWRAAVEATNVISAVPADSKKQYVGTHSGSFHCDEATAIGMLKLLPDYADFDVIRSRDPKELAKAQIVVDVGGTYDPSTHRYDHHQASFTTTYSDEHKITKLSSAGLIYKHFGPRIVRAILEEKNPSVDDATVNKIVLRTYEKFVLEVDAVDNGVEQVEDVSSLRYRVGTGLSSRVARLNQSWNEESAGPDDQNRRFKEAIALTGSEFLAVVQGYRDSWLPAREIVVKAVKESTTVHPSGAIIVLDRFCPWKDHLLELEEEAGGVKRVLYIVFQDSAKSWRIQAAPKESEGFATRKPLPSAWAGLRDAELSEKAGIEGCIFVHAGRFIGGNATKEGALAMAVKALELD